MFQALIGPIASLAGTFLEGQVSKSKAKATLAQTEAEAKSEVLKSAAMHDSKWELIMAESTKSGWKDEVVTIIVLAPCVMAWIDLNWRSVDLKLFLKCRVGIKVPFWVSSQPPLDCAGLTNSGKNNVGYAQQNHRRTGEE